ncbi:MAG: hypothetical protein ACYSTL_07380, partial [Planctomycetota bacterium]
MEGKIRNGQKDVFPETAQPLEGLPGHFLGSDRGPAAQVTLRLSASQQNQPAVGLYLPKLPLSLHSYYIRSFKFDSVG